MSVSVNLLPDVRQARLRAQHLRRLVTSLSILVWIIAVAVVVLLLLATGAQKLQISLLNKDIASRTAEVEAVPNLNDALTTQTALAALPDLYNKRAYYSVFLKRFDAATPSGVKVSSLATDDTGALTISGTAPSVATVDKFYESLKAAGGTSNQLFTSVQISSVSKDDSGKASYSMTATMGSGATTNTTDTGVTP